MRALHVTSFALVVIGALNWGLIAIGSFTGSNWNVVNLLLGAWPTVEWLVYLLVGLSAIVLIATHKKSCVACSAPQTPSTGTQM